MTFLFLTRLDQLPVLLYFSYHSYHWQRKQRKIKGAKKNLCKTCMVSKESLKKKKNKNACGCVVVRTESKLAKWLCWWHGSWSYMTCYSSDLSLHFYLMLYKMTVALAKSFKIKYLIARFRQTLMKATPKSKDLFTDNERVIFC